MSAHRNILFIDDDPAYREMIQRVATQWGRDRWTVFLAENAGQALSLIQDQAIDLAIIDIEMPVVDGLQLLNLIGRKYPQLQKVVMTAFATDQNRSASLAAGAELFLEKPRTVEGLESIFATLHELARWQPEQGFRGVLRQASLQDVIQMECLSRHSVLLEVLTPAARGDIFIQDGSVIHAQTGHLTGEDAFNHLLCLSGGEFNLKPYAAPPVRTIDAPWEFLLMEAARKRDEASEAIQSHAATPAWDQPVAHEPATLPAAFALPQAASTAGMAALPERPRTQVDEVFLCSPQGEVLYEWKCNDTAARIGLLEFVSQKARQLAQGLPLGKFDRVEMSCASSRLVLRIREDHAMLVRTSPYQNTGSLAMARG